MSGRGRPLEPPVSLGSVAFTAVLLAITAVLLASTTRLQASAAVVPRVVGIPAALLLASVLVRDVLRLTRTSGAAARTERLEARPEAPTRTRDEASAVLWVLALPACATVLGFVAGPALFVSAWARLRARESTAVAVVAGAGTAAAIVLIFGMLLGARLPHGLLQYFL